jgi:hypothetical protein
MSKLIAMTMENCVVSKKGNESAILLDKTAISMLQYSILYYFRSFRIQVITNIDIMTYDIHIFV